MTINDHVPYFAKSDTYNDILVKFFFLVFFLLSNLVSKITNKSLATKIQNSLFVDKALIE